MNQDQWMTKDEYESGGEEYSSKNFFGWFLTFGSWICFIIGILGLMDSNDGNWFLVIGLFFWLIANYKTKKATGEDLL